MSIANVLNDAVPHADARSEPETVELRWVAGYYTYFGWFPWSDFEGETLGEDRLEELTAWRHNAIAPIRKTSSAPASDRRRGGS